MVAGTSSNWYRVGVSSVPSRNALSIMMAFTACRYSRKSLSVWYLRSVARRVSWIQAASVSFEIWAVVAESFFAAVDLRDSRFGDPEPVSTVMSTKRRVGDPGGSTDQLTCSQALRNTASKDDRPSGTVVAA